MKLKATIIAVHLVLCLCMISPFAYAGLFDSFKGPLTGIHPLQNKRFIFSGAAYFPATDSDVLLGGGDGSAIEFDLEDTLGYDEDNLTPLTGFTWRMTDRWSLLSEYFRLSDEGDRILAVAIDTGDGTFITGGAGVVSDTKIDILRLAFGYSFLREENYELGAGLGVHLGNIDTSITGVAFVSDGMGGGANRTVTSEINQWAPLPNLALFGNYAITDEWLIDGRIDWFSAGFGNYDGNLWNISSSINWHPFEHVGFFFMYKFVHFDLEKEKNNVLDWKVDMSFNGPALGVRVTF